MENTSDPTPAADVNDTAAIHGLIKSCLPEPPNGSNCQSQSFRFIDVQHACDELMSLSFHSEDGRLRVIEKLTTLDGNFVVKIIRKGLVSLSKVYTDSKTFEEESLKLVDLCCSQSQSLKNDSGPQLASPALILDWVVALCDELRKAEEVSSRSSAVLISKCLSKLRDIYETIVRGRMQLPPKDASKTALITVEAFKVLFKTLLSRVQEERFEELIEQTVAITKTEEYLDFLKFSRIYTVKQALVLSRWIGLLKLSFLPNWFVVEVARHDFLVHDASYAQSLPFSDFMTYAESLICGVSNCISSITSSADKEKDFFCSKNKAKIFFEYSEIFLRHTSLCLQLMQSKEIDDVFTENLFFELGINLDRALLPFPTTSELEDCDFEISPDCDAMLAKFMSVREQSKQMAENKLISGRVYKNLSFEALTKALFTMPDNQQVLRIVQLWKQNFPDDKSHSTLFQLLVLVSVVMEGDKENISKNMDHLVEFLSQLPTECLRNLSLWQPTMVHLIPSLPCTWFGPEVIAFVQSFANLANRENDRSTGNSENLQEIPNFVLMLKRSSKSEDVKIKALQLGLDLLEQVPHPEEYRFALKVSLSVASDMETDGIKTFTLSLLKTARAHITRIRYLEIWQVISLIDLSRSIRCKSEVFEAYLKLLQQIKHDDIASAVITCRSFLKLPIVVDTDNVKRFLTLAATDEGLKTCKFILKCLDHNQTLLAEYSSVHEHVIFLITIKEKMPCKRSCELFFGSVYKYMEQQMLAFPCIDIFEIIIASIAGCITVRTIVSNRFEEVLRVVQKAVHTQRMDKPKASDVLSLFIHVAKTIDKAQRYGKKRDFADHFSRALCPIATLPLSLTQKVELMDKVTSILEQEKITDNQKLFNVMFHLFQLPSNVAASSMDSEALDSHFKEVVTPSIIRNVAEIPLMEKHDPNAGSVTSFSLTEALVERMPETFSNKTSPSLYRFIIERVEENPKLSCSVFPIVEAITKRPVSEAKLKEEFEEIEEVLLPLPTEFIHLIIECLRECCTVGVSHEEQSMKCLIIQIIDCLRQSKLNVDDGLRMMNSIMEIPKLLVLTFKEAKSPEEARNGMTRIFDVVKSLHPEFIAGHFLRCFGPGLKNQFAKVVSHDFYMLLKHTSLTAGDLCTAMIVYQSLKSDGLLNIFNLSMNQDFASVFQQWFSGINQPEIPTPGNLAYLVMQQLRRINIPETDIQSTTIEICCTILSNRCFRFGQVPMVGILGSPPPKQYLDMIISVLKESSHLAEIRHWLKTDCLTAVQCKDVIRAACSWRAGVKSCEAAIHVNTAVSETLSSLISKKVPPLALSSLGTVLAKELEVIVLVMQRQENKYIAVKLFELLCTSTQCAEACVDVVRSWSKEQTLLLTKKIAYWYKEKRQKEVNVEKLNNEIKIPLQVLPFAAKAFPNSADDVLKFLVKTTEVTGPEDHTSLGRLPVWCKQMTDAGYEAQAIQSWCSSFVLAENSCSSDVDSIANLTPEVINVLTAEPEENQIKQSLFCWQATQHLQTDKKIFKRCLILARLLNEFACILGHLKENVQVVQRIQQGVGELCSIFLDDSSTMNSLYKIRYKILEDLFILLFQGEKREHETSLRQLTSERRFSKSLVIILRRLARSVFSRPTTFGHIKSVVTTMLQHKTKNPDCKDQDIQQAVHLEVLHFESNQDAIHTLQAAGYNQSTSMNEDLWYSSSIQMPAYVPTVKSFEVSRKESLLRQSWREWKTLLTVHNISEVEVSGQMVKQGDLFKTSDSLEAMEAQLKSVQQAIQAKPLKQNGWSYYRQKELLRNEKRLRDKIAKQVQEVQAMTGTRRAKMVIVWENQLLESVKMCSEKIPHCYAPNGFHSEKPVICGIAVDNRILSVYKEDKGGTEVENVEVENVEVENVEVKLYPAGMVVFGAYCSVHPYDTEQLWAAFYKMLLDKRLVPMIFITNVSPAFDWIKQFIAPEVSSSRDINFISCCNLVPSSEDIFDYDPERHLLATHAALASSQTKELIILTPQKAAQLQIHSLKAPVDNRSRSLLMKEHIQRVWRHLEEGRSLQEMHPEPEERRNILRRLRTPITKAVEAIVDGDEPNQESISRSIDIKKLLPHQDVPHYIKDDYSAVILDAVTTVTGDVRDNNTCYDGCQHVVFS